MHTHRERERERARTRAQKYGCADTCTARPGTRARRRGARGGSVHTRVAHTRTRGRSVPPGVKRGCTAPAASTSPRAEPALLPGSGEPVCLPLTRGRSRQRVAGDRFAEPFEKLMEREKTKPPAGERCQDVPQPLLKQHDQNSPERERARRLPLLKATPSPRGEIAATNFDERAGRTSSLRKSPAGLGYVSIRARGWRAACAPK